MGPELVDGVSQTTGFALEAAMACYWCIVILLVPPYLHAHDAPKPMLLLACAPCFAFGRNFTGPSISPTMAIASSARLATSGVTSGVVLVYVIGPLVGAVVAAFVMTLIDKKFPFRFSFADSEATTAANAPEKKTE